MKLFNAIIDRLAFFSSMIVLAFIGLASPYVGWKMLHETAYEVQQQKKREEEANRD